ncbi:hypothetical protein [Mesorhizobium sp.]|uniref:hypothetical protein n=1 Tax=Mesorhizobium sp. TaxID=1871066 RepID=UPI000FE95E40|nr:hypothetical protein [Mesorhizobium sp.]RWG01077.1 MAG: hypothetical protein EOQ54_24560 [Mesorhizobium sp.]TIN48355.1 MAG: hypothetical protein E5Y25_03045 [Mesorhizobium sp.]TIR90830.1 MAG: hypothetical protein E5X08_21695 [Mesorhizobium sp.]
MEQDRRSIGLSSESQRLMEELLAKDWFAEAQEAARFAMAYAIRAGVTPGVTPGSVDTRWSSGLFDPTGEIVALIGSLYPDNNTPVRAIEMLVNEGLRLVHERLVTRAETPADLIGG